MTKSLLENSMEIFDRITLVVHISADLLDHRIIEQVKNSMEIFDRITLVVHISADLLDHRIIEQVDAWEGPVTLSVVIPSVGVLSNIHKIQHKLSQLPKSVLQKLSAHLLFRSKNGCTTDAVTSLNEEDTIGKYPVNVARNVARMLVRSKYILLGDYEFIFSKGFESRMRKLANDELTKNPKTALVFRIFEVNDTIQRLPRDKATLRKLFFDGMVVEFHAKFTHNAHKIPRLIDWFNHPVDNSKASLNTILPFSRRDWEPQFVSLNTIPFHDENFPFSLRDNTVLRWEMCRQNYTFVLVNDMFMVHRGIKTVKDAPETKKLQKRSRSQFTNAIELFRKRMDKFFPETKQKCPEFGA
uniref:Beta-1,4-glucuronyltransferase 1 n=1 Tax=Ascaris lumbricoides TaxID=6252 RepID=A0A0M3HYE3_ASCLU